MAIVHRIPVKLRVVLERTKTIPQFDGRALVPHHVTQMKFLNKDSHEQKICLTPSRIPIRVRRFELDESACSLPIRTT